MNIKPMAVICFLCVVLLWGACSSKFPDKQTLMDDLQKGLNWKPLKDSLSLENIFELVDLRITKSSVTCDEECECVLSFKGKVRTLETFYYSSQYKGAYYEIPEWGLGNKQAWLRANRGRYCDFAGQAFYDLFDTGWKIRQFDAPILNSNKETMAKFIPKIVLKDK
ncbi:MAG: hypothetical protein OMM_14187, partial [Candidatus Magnetoglobus multicellularis str. Araruama]